jgi:hypothetical protein
MNATPGRLLVTIPPTKKQPVPWLVLEKALELVIDIDVYCIFVSFSLPTSSVNV